MIIINYHRLTEIFDARKMKFCSFLMKNSSYFLPRRKKKKSFSESPWILTGKIEIGQLVSEKVTFLCHGYF